MKHAASLWIVPAAISVLLGGCGAVGTPDVTLGVPFRAQHPDTRDCGPASILMWRRYHGLPELTQKYIGDYLGGASTGLSQDAIADGVNIFTHTHDAFWDLEGDSSPYVERFIARQITSIDSRVPVIAILSSLHAGVVNGGKWHDRADGLKQWDYVYFHDPWAIPSDYYTPGNWIANVCNYSCQQVISSSASNAWQYNLENYKDFLVVGGGGFAPRDY